MQVKIEDIKKVTNLLLTFEADLNDKIIWETEPTCCGVHDHDHVFHSPVLGLYRQEKVNTN